MSFPATFNINYYKGDFYQFVVRPKTSTGDPFPISDTTHTAHFYLSPERGGDSTNTKQGQATIDGNNVVVTIVPTLGKQLDGSTWFYDVSVEKNESINEIYTLVTGTISITEEIKEPGS